MNIQASVHKNVSPAKNNSQNTSLSQPTSSPIRNINPIAAVLKATGLSDPSPSSTPIKEKTTKKSSNEEGSDLTWSQKLARREAKISNFLTLNEGSENNDLNDSLLAGDDDEDDIGGVGSENEGNGDNDDFIASLTRSVYIYIYIIL